MYEIGTGYDKAFIKSDRGSTPQRGTNGFMNVIDGLHSPYGSEKAVHEAAYDHRARKFKLTTVGSGGSVTAPANDTFCERRYFTDRSHPLGLWKRMG
jgi:hypothetical protein